MAVVSARKVRASPEAAQHASLVGLRRRPGVKRQATGIPHRSEFGLARPRAAPGHATRRPCPCPWAKACGATQTCRGGKAPRHAGKATPGAQASPIAGVGATVPAAAAATNTTKLELLPRRDVQRVL